MKIISNRLLTLFVTMASFAVPLFATSPFDVKSLKLDPKKTINFETTKTAEVNVAESPSVDASVKIKMGIITASALNIRSTPWGDIIGTYKKGDHVEILGTLGDWYKVNYKGLTGYIHSNWVTTEGKQGQTKPKYGVVTNCLWTNVHRTPSGDVLSKLQSGAQVYILGEVGDWYKIKYNNNEAFVSKKYIDLTGSGESTDYNNNSNSDQFTGYVNATALNVRNGPWGNIIGLLYKGDNVKVTGKVGDWYTIDYNGTTKYVSANYIYNPNTSGISQDNYTYNSSNSSSSNATSAANGSLQQQIVASARALVGSTNFRTSDVSGGRLACAKVATTALKNAGALDRVYLNCRDSVKALKAKGWVEVTPPPYQEGDVITWKTYDYTGDGVKDEDTHIGIIVKEGNTFKAMNNSSSLRTPRITNINIAPTSRVLRKVN